MYTQQSLAAHIAKKHPNSYSLTTSENTHCVLGHTVYAFVETEDEKLMYSTDKAGRCRLVDREKLTPTYRSVRMQPKNCVIRVAGEGPYKGLYMLNETIDGWYNTTPNISDAKPMSKWVADQVRSRIAFNAQHCYGGKFEVVAIS